MSPALTKRMHQVGPRRPYVKAERLVAIAAVAATAFGFAQPQVLILAGLDFERPSMNVRHGVDPTPTGAIATPADIGRPTTATVHGLAGTLKALRAHN